MPYSNSRLKRPVSDRLTTFLGLVWVIVLFAILPIRAAKQNRSLGGDEVHYLVASISLVQDGDFDLSNNYKDRVYSKPPLNMDYQWPHCHPYYKHLSAKCLPVHSFWYSTLIAPLFYLGGAQLVFAFNALLMLLAAAAFGLTLNELLGSPRKALLYSFLFALSGPILNSSVPIFPTALSTFLTSLGLWFLAKSVSQIPSKKISTQRHWTKDPLLGVLVCFCLHPYAHHTNSLIAGTGLLFAFAYLRNQISIRHLVIGALMGGIWFVTPYLFGGSVTMGASVSAPAFVIDGFWRKLQFHLLNGGQGLIPNSPILLALIFSGLSTLLVPKFQTNIRATWRFFVLLSAALLLISLAFFSFANTGPGDSPIGRYFVYLAPLFTLGAILTLESFGYLGILLGCALFIFGAWCGLAAHKTGCHLANCYPQIDAALLLRLKALHRIFLLEQIPYLGILLYLFLALSILVNGFVFYRHRGERRTDLTS